MAECICTICGYEGKPRKTKRGSKGMEVFIWAVLLVPGPVYSLYRRVALPKICPNCKANSMVSLRSDAGKLALHKMQIELGEIEIKKPEPFGQDTPELFEQDRERQNIPKQPVDPDAW